MTHANIPDPVLMDMLWAKTEPTSFLSKELFIRGLDGWNIKPVWMDDELAFVTAQRGPDFHFQSMGGGHKLTRAMINDYLQKIINEHGYAATKTPVDDVKQRRFNELFGFKVVGEDEYEIHYRIEGLR